MTKPKTSLHSRPKETDRLGNSLAALCGGALALELLLVLAILGLLLVNGGAYFWQRDLVELTLNDGKKVVGEIWEKEQRVARIGEQTEDPTIDRLRLKLGNRDIGGLDFAWIDRKSITSEKKPAGATVFERLEYGNFYGEIREIRAGEQVLAADPEAAWQALGQTMTV